MQANSNFCLLIVTYSLPFGSFLAVGGLMSNIFDPFGFSPSEVSFISLGLLVSGVVGAISVGAFLDKFEKYRLLMGLSLGLVCISTFSVASALYMDAPKAVITACLVVGGFFGTGYFPLCFAYAAELTFPISPALVNGMMTMSGSTMSVLIGIVGTLIASGHDTDETLSESDELVKLRAIAIVSMMPIAALISFFLNFCIREDLKRLNYGKSEEEVETLKAVDMIPAKQDIDSSPEDTKV